MTDHRPLVVLLYEVFGDGRGEEGGMSFVTFVDEYVFVEIFVDFSTYQVFLIFN